MDFDLKQLAGMLLKRWWIILLCALLCAGLFYSYTVLYVTPMYTTSTMLMVSTQNGNYTGLNTAEAFVPLTPLCSAVPLYLKKPRKV